MSETKEKSTEIRCLLWPPISDDRYWLTEYIVDKMKMDCDTKSIYHKENK